MLRNGPGKRTEGQRGKHASPAALFQSIGDAGLPLLLYAAVLLFDVWPMACILFRSLRGEGGGIGLAAYAAVWDRYLGPLKNSVTTALATAALCTAISLACAIFLSTRKKRARAVLRALVLAALVSPPFVSSLAYIQLYGRRGWITYRLLGISRYPYGQSGVVWMQALSFAPVSILLLLEMIDRTDRSAVLAASDLGAPPTRVLTDVLLPSALPGIAASLLLCFIRSAADFSTPMIIGGRFSTLASEIYTQLIGYADLTKASAMNMFLLVPSVAAFFLYRRVLKEDRAPSARAAQASVPLPLARCGLPGLLALAGSALFFVMTALQYGCVFLLGFLKSTKGVYSFTLQNLERLFTYSGTILVRSVVYALLVAVFGSLFAVLFAYYTDRRSIPLRSFFSCSATIPYMIPGSCFGIGYILAFNHAPLKLTGTALIVIANMLFKQLPTTTKMCSSALTRVSPDLERAARDLGGGRLSVIRDVILPNMRGAYLNCFIYNFTSSMTTAGAILFLIDPGRQLAVFKLFDAVSSGEYPMAAMLATAITVIVLSVEGLAALLIRRPQEGT